MSDKFLAHVKVVEHKIFHLTQVLKIELVGLSPSNGTYADGSSKVARGRYFKECCLAWYQLNLRKGILLKRKFPGKSQN